MIDRAQVSGHPATAHSRRNFLRRVAASGAAAIFASETMALAADHPSDVPHRRVPVIDTTDLYHPHQDAGDNFDIIAPYAMPEIDLRAVVLDATEKYRQPPEGPRDPGFVPVIQLNSIFNRNVPCATTPYNPMKSPTDKMLDAPRFQQAGIELILNTLRQSAEKVDITIFGSSKSVAAAFNRDPDLLRTKLGRIHLSAGASSPEFLEWNVLLDQQAIVCLLRSDLPIAIYPCATKDGPFAYGPHNSFYKLPNLKFIADMEPRLRRYLIYAMDQTKRLDFLRVLEEDPPADVQARAMAKEQAIGKYHAIWETAIWMQIADRRLVQRADKHFRIIPAGEVLASDRVLPNDLRPCQVKVLDNGAYEFQLTSATTNRWIYDRGDPQANEVALCEALPRLYLDFKP
jgi:pyrimidine-specific ribonucleoside hydrolase